jgi:hypothetical protein
MSVVLTQNRGESPRQLDYEPHLHVRGLKHSLLGLVVLRKDGRIRQLETEINHFILVVFLNGNWEVF